MRLATLVSRAMRGAPPTGATPEEMRIMTAGGYNPRGGAKAAPRDTVHLPKGGFKGKKPRWPLEDFADPAEKRVWDRLWKTPQAAAWIDEPWRWDSVAMLARVTVRAQDQDAPASVLAQYHRFQDAVGMSAAGLRENGWVIDGEGETARRSSPDEVLKPRGETAAAPVRRLRAAQ